MLQPCCYTIVVLFHGWSGKVLIYYTIFLGVTIKETDSNSGATLVDVGLSKVCVTCHRFLGPKLHFFFVLLFKFSYFLFLSFPLLLLWHPSLGHRHLILLSIFSCIFALSLCGNWHLATSSMMAVYNIITTFSVSLTFSSPFLPF